MAHSTIQHANTQRPGAPLSPRWTSMSFLGGEVIVGLDHSESSYFGRQQWIAFRSLSPLYKYQQRPPRATSRSNSSLPYYQMSRRNKKEGGDNALSSLLHAQSMVLHKWLQQEQIWNPIFLSPSDLLRCTQHFVLKLDACSVPNQRSALFVLVNQAYNIHSLAE
jgi:hypothetical protein